MPDRLTANVLAPAEAGAGAISAEVRRECLQALRSLTKRHLPAEQLLSAIFAAARAILRKYEPYLARVASDAWVAAFLEGGHGIIRRLPTTAHSPDPLLKLVALLKSEPPKPPSWITRTAAPDEPEPWVTFPIIDEAARDLAGRELMHANTFYNADRAARLQGFTVSRVSSLDALERIRDGLVDAVADGGTLKQFREHVAEALDGSRLGAGHVETVFRTGIMGAYSRGQKAVIEQPLVRSAFPFIRRVEIRDGRLTDLCKALSAGGIDGTDIFCLDDPLWPILFAPTSHWNCRCGTIPLTLERAARKLKVAQRWLSTGKRPPDDELFVKWPTYPDGSRVELPTGWVSPWAA